MVRSALRSARVLFDTPDLESAGVVVRARRGGEGDDRSSGCARSCLELPRKVRESNGMVEVDAMPGGLSARFDEGRLTRPRRRRGRVRTAAQAVPGSSAPSRRMRPRTAFEDLSLLARSSCSRSRPRRRATRKMVVELWLYPDGSGSYLTKCALDEAFQVAAESHAWPSATSSWRRADDRARKALEFFSGELKRTGDRERRDPDTLPRNSAAEPWDDHPHGDEQPRADPREEQRRRTGPRRARSSARR